MHEDILGDDSDILQPAELILEPDIPGRLNVLVRPAWRARYAEMTGRPAGGERPAARLMSFDTALQAMAIFPVRTFPGSNFLRPKHPPFTEFVLENWTRRLPQSAEEVTYELAELPGGFIRDPGFGLGIDKEFMPILDAVRRLKGVRSLVLREDGPTGPDGARYCMTYDDYDDLRRAMHRTTARYRAEARADRTILAHNKILTALDPQRFPEARRTYTPGTVFKLLDRRAERSTLNAEDGKALVRTLAQAAPTMTKTPEQLFALGEMVERVSLELLIDRFKDQLEKGGREAQWQRLLDLNPFILSLVFGYPIVRLASQGTVGGWRLKGGSKIADYVVKNQKTQAIALVELKTPGTPLTSSDYRTGVPDVSPKLTGAVMQVLDQRLKLQKSLSLIKDEEDDVEIRSAEALGIDCMVIAGRTPTDRKAIKTFELFRSGLKDVRILTFDELLAKMEALLTLLSDAPGGPTPPHEAELF